MALIYIVEDDDSIQEIESVALKASGHELEEGIIQIQKCPNITIILY